MVTKTATRPVADTTAAPADNGTGDAPVGTTASVNVEGVQEAEASKDVLKRIKASAKAAVKASQSVTDKVQIAGKIRQKLAEIADMENGVSGEADKVSEEASTVAGDILTAMTSGAFSREEVNAMLLDTFGHRVTSTGNESKTPAGTGKAIRDRVFRLGKASEYVGGGEGDRFVRNLDKDELSSVLSQVESGTIGVWQAYNVLTDMAKGERPPRIPAAFNPKAIDGLVDKLTEAGAAVKLADNPGLIKSYVLLIRTLDIYGIVEEAQAE